MCKADRAADSLLSAGLEGLSYPVAALPTDSSFVLLFKQFTSFVFGSEEVKQAPPADPQSSGGYQVGLCLEGGTAVVLSFRGSSQWLCLTSSLSQQRASGRGF